MTTLLIAFTLLASGAWDYREQKFPSMEACTDAIAMIPNPKPPKPEFVGNYSFIFCHPEAVLRVAASGTVPTRPLYDAQAWAATQTWKQIGNVEVGRPCENALPSRTTTAAKYYFTINLKGQRGLAACRP